MTVYSDIADMPENERIHVIGETASAGSVVGFVVENDVKADRYLRKLQRWFPGVRVIDRGPGPVANTILVRCGPKQETQS